MKWTASERRLLHGLRTPAHIQKFLDELSYDPRGGASVRVSFEVANFDQLMNWFDTLARDYSVQVRDFSADKVEGLGLVNARVTLEDSAH